MPIVFVIVAALRGETAGIPFVSRRLASSRQSAACSGRYYRTIWLLDYDKLLASYGDSRKLHFVPKARVYASDCLLPRRAFLHRWLLV
jgi:hypothetical protein